MAKKKISFDIEAEDFETMKEVAKSLNLGQGELLRKAVKTFINSQENFYTTIYVLADDKIQKFVVNLNDFETNIFDADGEMKKVCRAVKEGDILSYIKDRSNIDNKELLKLLRLLDKKGHISFFIKD